MKKILFYFTISLFLIYFTGVSFADIDLGDDDFSGPQKSSWYIGFGFGTGNGGYEINGEEVTYDDFFEGAEDTSPRITFNFGVGGILTPNFHLGLDINAIRQEGSSGSIEGSLQINNYLAALSYYPFVKGFFLKGGLGFAVIQAELGTYSESYNGYAFLGGLGYQFWLGETFNLGINAEYSRQSYNDEDGPDNSHFWNIYVSFYWL